ncbi:MAG: hypothetical protein K6F27_00110 [Ruminococcus sp.]|nr:hypothetical protein [Ruminococcus sp.]
MNTAEYDYLWTTEKNNWVLVKSSYGYGIINKATQSMLMVYDDELEKELIERMLDEGCKTYDNINDAYADD